MSAIDLAAQVMERIEALAGISEEPGRLTRTFASPAMGRANDLVGSWMQAAGMSVSVDAIGNLVGRLPGSAGNAKTFLLGSHLDTVRDAGKFDGPLGVLVSLACVEHLRERGARLSFALEVIGFADEEGVRYQTTYLGSKAMAGCFNEQDLRRVDARGIAMAQAIREFGGDPTRLDSVRRNPQELLGYAEVHIEQGPVLEEKNLPVGVVTAIVGQARIKARFTGRAGHAGTTPRNLRHDALAGAAEFIAAVEASMGEFPGLVATVGQIETKPGASNVIPGEVILSVDVRHQTDATRGKATLLLKERANQVAAKRGLAMEWEIVHEAQSVPCSGELTARLADAARRHVSSVIELPSGAGHDAAIMGGMTPITMLFVRCRGGISHHPDESVTVEDVRVAIAVMSDFLLSLAKEHA